MAVASGAHESFLRTRAAYERAGEGRIQGELVLTVAEGYSTTKTGIWRSVLV